MQRTLYLFSVIMLAACGPGEHKQRHGTPPGRTGGTPGPTVTPPGPTPPINVPPTTTATKPSTDQDVRFIGRFDRSDGRGAFMAWSASSVVTRFTGTTLAVSIEPPAEQQTYAGKPVNNYYDVFVDKHPPVVVPVKQGQTLYPVSNDLGPGEHVAWLVKRTEPQMGIDRFLGFKIAGDGAFLTPPAPQPHRMEFIGDSITVGFGDEGTVGTCEFAPSNENVDATFAALSADAFNAEFTDLAFAGKGLYRNRDPINDPVRTMPYLYKRTIPEQGAVWDFSVWTPEVVVINLGTNDYKAPGAVDQAAFTQAYKDFVHFVRSTYPKAAIFCAVGPELHADKLDAARAAVQQAVSDATGGGDGQVFFIEFAEDHGDNGYGCQYHPNRATHKLMAQVLQEAIHAKVGW